MKHPWLEIKQSVEEIWVHTDKETASTIYEGELKPALVTDICTEILKKNPRIRIVSEQEESSDYITIFRKYTDGENHSSFARHCTDPFQKRKTYAMINPESTFGFDVVAL